MSDENNLTSGDFVRSLGASIQANPVPSALIGMGIVWLFSGGGSSMTSGLAKVGVGLSHLRTNGDEWGQGGNVRDTATSIGQTVNDGKSAATKKVSDAASSIGERVSPFLPTAQSSLADLMQKQPLMLGAIGLGIGAAMAAAFRSTAFETNLLGQASTDLQARVHEVAAATTEHAAKLADSVTSAMTNEARAQGLTLEDLKHSASEASRKIKSVADQTAGAARAG